MRTHPDVRELVRAARDAVGDHEAIRRGVRGAAGDAERRLADALGVRPATLRSWASRGRLPRGTEERLRGLMIARTAVGQTANGASGDGDSAALTPATSQPALEALVWAQDTVRRILDYTGGRGPVWRSMQYHLAAAEGLAREQAGLPARASRGRLPRSRGR